MLPAANSECSCHRVWTPSTGLEAKLAGKKAKARRFVTINKTKKGEQKVIWTATLDGDQLRGTRTRKGAKRSVPFTAKRQD